MVEVTQSDRQAARDCLAELAGHNWGLEYILDGMDDENETVQAFARHRIAAEQRCKLEGARLAIEEISLIVHDQDRETVAALDPAKIVGEG